MRITLDTTLSLREIRNEISGKYATPVEKDVLIHAISTDSRECRKGDLFIALNGDCDSGEKYISEALMKGCSVISSSDDSRVIKVVDTGDALFKLASLYKTKTAISHTVAVTGSVGKSTTVKMISKILSQKYKVHSTVGNFNNHIGVPLTLLSSPADADVIVVELGMNHRNEISSLSKCVRPDIAVITSIGTAHIGNLGSRENIALAKSEIVSGMNGGSVLVPEQEMTISFLPNRLTVARDSLTSDFSLNGTGNLDLTFYSKYGKIDKISFCDSREHMIYNLSYAIAISQMLGLSPDEIKRGILSIKPSDFRQRFIKLKRFTIFDDSYNSSLEAIIADFKYLSRFDTPTGAFLGDVLELGEKAESVHSEIGRAAVEYGIGRLYLHGKYSKHIASGAVSAGFDERRIYVNEDLSAPNVSVKQIRQHCEFGEIILFKASHKLRFDKIADMIAKEDGENDCT